MKNESMTKGMKDMAPKPFDKSTGPKAVGGGSVNDMPTRKMVPKVTSPGPRSA